MRLVLTRPPSSPTHPVRVVLGPLGWGGFLRPTGESSRPLAQNPGIELIADKLSAFSSCGRVETAAWRPFITQKFVL